MTSRAKTERTPHASVRQHPTYKTSHPRLVGVGTAFPPYYYSQQEIIDAAKELWTDNQRAAALAERMFKRVLVGGRHLSLPLDRYLQTSTFAERNDAFIDMATDVGAQAVRAALAHAQLAPSAIDAIFFTTVTGIAVPSIDARLINRLGLRSDITRTPLFGLGCLAGAAGIARMADYLRAYPKRTAMLVSIELCSLTLQPQDLSVANMVASGLFGDGAAAIIAQGAACKRAPASKMPQVIASCSSFYPNSEEVMGWRVGEQGFQIQLSAEVPATTRDKVVPDIHQFLADHSLNVTDIDHWICHPGGPKVLEALAQALSLDDEALRDTWESLREHGNMSSTSVLVVFERTLARKQPRPGERGLVLAMGPGFCAELVLVQW